MNEDIVFRKASVGGFNRNDVMDYIGRLKEEISVSRAENEKLAADNAALTAEIEKLNEDIRTGAEEYSEKLDTLKAEHEAAIEELNEQYARAAAESSLPEAEIGKAMLDVRRYSDLLISETSEKINDVAVYSDNAANTTIEEVTKLSADIRTFRSHFEESIAALIDENDALTKKLTDFVGSVNLPFEKAQRRLAKLTAESQTTKEGANDQ